MKIITDIDDDLYTRLFDNGVENYDDAENIARAIRKGIPIPERKDTTDENIKEILACIIKHIRPDGDFYSFSHDEVKKMKKLLGEKDDASNNVWKRSI